VTSNEIAIREHAEVDSWTAVLPDVVELAKFIADTEFVPATLRKRPAAIAAAILSGREMQIGPMRALAHVHMIDGRPSLSAEQKRAAALAAGHEIVYVQTTTTRCEVKGRRKGSEEWSAVTWTKDDADKAGISGKPNWRKWPRRMLQARATGELCDMIFPDATAGLATTEELVDDTDAVGITSNGQEAPKKRTARRQTAVESEHPTRQGGGALRADSTLDSETVNTPQSTPPLPGEDGYDETAGDSPNHRPASAGAVKNAGAEPSTPSDGRNLAPAGSAQQENTAPALPGGITRSQLTKLHVVFSKLDYHDRDDRLRAASAVVGRKLGSSTELTREEAIALIDTLEALGNRDALEDLLAQVAIQETFDAEIVEGEG
jgi:hypothetical protein